MTLATESFGSPVLAAGSRVFPGASSNRVFDVRRLPGLPSVTNRPSAFRTDGTAWRWRWLAELEGERSEESGEGGR